MNQKPVFPICVKITSEAVKEHRSLFGALAKKEMEDELTYYIRMHELAGRKFNGRELTLNYDNRRAVFLYRTDLRFWDVIGFGKAEEYCPVSIVEKVVYSRG